MLLADEPTGNLDVKTANMVLDLIQQLHRRYQLTSVIATHNSAVGQQRCQRVLRLEGGSLRAVAKLAADRV